MPALRSVASAKGMPHTTYPTERRARAPVCTVRDRWQGVMVGNIILYSCGINYIVLYKRYKHNSLYHKKTVNPELGYRPKDAAVEFQDVTKILVGERSGFGGLRRAAVDVIILYSCGIIYIALYKRYKGVYDIIYIPIANHTRLGPFAHVIPVRAVLRLVGPCTVSPALTRARLIIHVFAGNYYKQQLLV